MLADLFKSLNSSLEDVLKNAEAGEGTIVNVKSLALTKV